MGQDYIFPFTANVFEFWAWHFACFILWHCKEKVDKTTVNVVRVLWRTFSGIFGHQTYENCKEETKVCPLAYVKFLFLTCLLLIFWWLHLLRSMHYIFFWLILHMEVFNVHNSQNASHNSVCYSSLPSNAIHLV